MSRLEYALRCSLALGIWLVVYWVLKRIGPNGEVPIAMEFRLKLDLSKIGPKQVPKFCGTSRLAMAIRVSLSLREELTRCLLKGMMSL